MKMSNYPMAECEKLTSIGLDRRQTLRERLVEQKTALEAQLANVKDALEFMDKNPSFENFHNTISKAGF
jgi:hypothetical protein